AGASPAAGWKRHAVVEPPVLPGVSPKTVEPARIRSDAPVVVNRHLETTASVDRKRRPPLHGERAVWKHGRSGVLLEACTGCKVRHEAPDSRQVVEETRRRAQPAGRVATVTDLAFN